VIKARFLTSLLRNKMDTLVGDYYLFDKQLYKCENINFQLDTSTYLLYEVIRCENAVLIFLEDHLNRLKEGIERLGILNMYAENQLKEEISGFLRVNGRKTGNVKIVCSPRNNELSFAAFFIPHFYPDIKIIEEGVSLITYRIERSDPQIKQIHVSNQIRLNVEEIKKNSGAYEVLLVDNENCITEGSKSNFFLVKGDTIYSAYPERILGGITRKYVLSIAELSGIKIKYSNLYLDNIDEYEAAFICGTSPKILPVREINSIQYTVENSIVNLIKKGYDAKIEEYIKINSSISLG
jgi:branched-chain amino acid aminotransferase